MKIKGIKNKIGMHDKIKNKTHSNFTTCLILLIVLSSFSLCFSVKSDFPSSDSCISFNVYFDKPVLTEITCENKTYTHVKINNCVSHGSLGDPALPFYTSKILIPQGKKIAGIDVVPSRSKIVSYNLKDKPVIPEQKAFPLSIGADDSFIINDTIYNSTEPVNDKIYTDGEIGFCRGFEILTIYLHPIFYIPKNGVIRYYPNIKVTVNLEEKPAVLNEVSNSFLRLAKEDISFVGSIIDNPEDIGSYKLPPAPLGGQPFDYENGICNSSDSYDYVIITSQTLKDTTGYSYNWSDLISHRQNYSGLSGIVVTVQEIDSCTTYWNGTGVFNDSSAHIREFCKDAYQDWGTQYILLGGDWDDSNPSYQVVPYRLFEDRLETNPYDTMACDKYFSHLDGNWYYSAGGIWGGGKSSGVNDFYGELIIGRITVYDAESVSNSVSKIINYDTNSSLSNEWYSTAAFCGGNLGWTITSKDYMDEIRQGTDTYRTFTGFEEWNSAKPDYQINTSVRLYHADLGGSYTTDFSNSIENDEFSMLNHIDHSSWTIPFGLSNWPNRYNTKPFFGVSQGCLAGRFHSGLAGCEQMICAYSERHAFGLVLNTGYGYGNPFSTDGSSQYVHAFFWDYFFNNQSDNFNNWQLGKAMMYTSDKMGSVVNSNPAWWCYSWYSAHYFGDPAQKLKLNSESNNTVTLSNENPTNGSIDVSILTTTLQIDMQDLDGNTFNWSIETSPNIGSNFSNSETNGTKTCNISILNYSTTYYWFANVTDGNISTNETYHFTTQSLAVNSAPILSNPLIGNDSTGVSISTTQLNITIKDSEGDSFNWSIETSPNIGFNSGNNENNGSKICNITGLNYNTNYTWYVNATDGLNITREWFNFTTRPMYLPNPPSSFTASALNRTKINLSWTHGSSSDKIYIRYDTSTYPSNRTSGSYLCNETGNEFNATNLDFGTQYFFRAWAWNDTDNLWSNSYSEDNITTDINTAPILTSPSPNNGSTNEPISFNWSIVMVDSDADSFNWSIECSNGQSNSVDNEFDGTKQLNLSGLEYGSDYNVWVNATDSYNWTREWFNFSTESMNLAPILTNPIPSNQSASVSKELTDLSITIRDTEGDFFNWSIETFPDIGSNSSNNCTNGSKCCTLTGLSYSTTYFWYVNVTDGNSTRNETFWFSTQDQPSSSGSNPSPPPAQGIVNIAPSSNAGGPYAGDINENILFDGSSSNDIDGSIVLYSWDFGDGSIGTGRKVNHSYDFSGNFTVTLTVKDNLGSTNIDTTSATISDEIYNGPVEIIPKSPLGNETENDTEDLNNNGIPDTIEEEFGGTNITNSSIIKELKITNDKCYLIDTDEDGEVDKYFNSENKDKTNIKKIGNGLYLIDSDGDGDYDYEYNIDLNILSSYSPTSHKKTTGNTDQIYIFVIVTAIIGTVIGVLLCFEKIISMYFTNKQLKHIDGENSFKKLRGKKVSKKQQSVHYFSKDEEEQSQNYYIVK